MALTKNELLEMINSTISSNGTKAITGDALNAALTALVEASQQHIYEFPEGIWAANYKNPYIFTEAEAEAFRTAWANRATTRFVARGTKDGFEFFAELAGLYDANNATYFFGAGGQSFWDNIFVDLEVSDEDGVLKSYV